MPTPHPIRGRRTNEELFFEHYPQILEWASQLTHLDRDDAEDLVQDFYVQVKCINLPLAEVDEIEPYLFKILRNLHYTRLRRKGRSPISELSIAEYDSLERGLVAADRRDLLLVHADLRAVCEYACQRKRTAARASIFILRFFFGYRPSEVMKVVLASRTAVDRSLQLARREALQYLHRPRVAQPVLHQEQQSISVNMVRDQPHAFFLELRQTILNSCEGPCFERSALEQRYHAKSPARFTIHELSHLVSCKTCLDCANAILGLPLLDSRSPDDTIGRDNPPGPGDSAPRLTITRGKKRGAGPKERTALERRMQEILEHRPARLEIAVNGETRTAQRVTAEVSELHLKLSAVEEPKFIEVFSEQGVRLAYLHVTEPTLYPGLEQRQHIALSDGRSLDLTLAFANDLPTVRVVYNDPLFAQVAAFEDDTDDLDAGAASEVSDDSRQLDCITEPKSVIALPAQHWIFLRWLKVYKVPVLRMNPLFGSAIVLAVVSASCLLFWQRSGPGMTAGAFLEQAQMQDSSVAANPQPGVVFQAVRIKTQRRTVNRGIYRDAHGIRTPRHQELSQEDALLKDTMAGADVDWNQPLSADSYQDWHDHQRVREDSIARVGSHLLALTTKVPDGAVIEQSLTVRDSDFHPVERTVKFRDHETIDIAELRYEVLPWTAVDPDLFNPMQPIGGLPAIPVPPHASFLAGLPSMPTEGQMDEAELSARLTLNRLHADTGEQIEVARGPHGIEIRGITDTEKRKHELEAQLYMLPHVTASITSIEERKAKPSQPDELSSVKVIEMQTQTTPLEIYYLAHGRNIAPLGDLAQSLFHSAFAIGLESRTIANLRRKLSQHEGISVVASATLADLLFTHKHKLLAALEDEEQLLAYAQIEAPRSKRTESTNGTDLALADLAERNLALTRELALGKGGSGRSAEAIASELATSMSELNLRVHEIQVAPREFTKLDKRK